MVWAAGALFLLYKKETKKLFGINSVEINELNSELTTAKQDELSPDAVVDHTDQADQPQSKGGVSFNNEGKLSVKEAMMMMMIVFWVTALFMVVYLVLGILDNKALPDLDQMEKRSGVITSVFKARVGRVTNSFFSLQSESGKSMRYLSDYRLHDHFNRIKGQQITVWSVPIALGGFGNKENDIMQIQHQDRLILDYENEYRARIERNLENAGDTIEIIFIIFFASIMGIASWVIKICIQRLIEAKGRENNGCS